MVYDKLQKAMDVKNMKAKELESTAVLYCSCRSMPEFKLKAEAEGKDAKLVRWFTMYYIIVNNSWSVDRLDLSVRCIITGLAIICIGLAVFCRPVLSLAALVCLISLISLFFTWKLCFKRLHQVHNAVWKHT